LPNLLAEVEEGRDAINVILSKDETDISPVRLMSNGITALVSITRGCDNMCTFCVVPLPVDASAVVSPEHHEGNSGFMGQRLQRNHTSWTKCRQLPVVWRRVEKEISQLLLKYKSNGCRF
jgi:hypothetical protein